jgi:hypothetical protein
MTHLRDGERERHRAHAADTVSHVSWIPRWLKRLLGISAPSSPAPSVRPAPTDVREDPAASSAGASATQQVTVSRVELGEDERALAVLGQFRDELKSHHAVQSELASLIRELHAPMRALPELARQQGGLMETLVDQSSRSRSRDQAIERSLHQLTEGAARQTQVLGLVQQQLDLNHETSIRVSDSLRDTASALGAFAATTDRQTRALEALAESTRRRLAQSERLERTLQFWLLVVSGLATLILLYALWAAMRVPPTPPARPEVVASDADAAPRSVPSAATQGSASTLDAAAPSAGSAGPAPAPVAPSTVGTAAAEQPGRPVQPAASLPRPVTAPAPATAPAAPASTIP